jgi:hypothetical protein
MRFTPNNPLIGITPTENKVALSRGQLLRIQPPPADRYAVKITAAKATLSRSGSRMMRVEVEIIEGPFAGRAVTTYFPADVTSGVLNRFTELLEALGLLDEDWGDVLDLDRLIGLLASVDIGYESSEQGREFPRLEDWQPLERTDESA